MIGADAVNAFESAGWETRAVDYGNHWSGLTHRLADPLLDAVGRWPAHPRTGCRMRTGIPSGACGRPRCRSDGNRHCSGDGGACQRRHPRAGFRQADAQSLPFPDNTFDAVVGSLAVPHFGRPEQAVAEFSRVLSSNGRLALTTWDLSQRARLVGVLAEAVREVGVAPSDTIPEGPDFFRFADGAEFQELLSRHGFIDVVVKPVAFTHRVSSSGELWNGLLRGTVRTSAVILGQAEDVLKKIRAAFDERVDNYRTDQTYELPVAFKLAAGQRG